ncbi:aminotransferase-like domain-containing protein [Paenibacillus segetis]|uniref:aminotransferase-like domain-containing protein n=1 Tax=Paenibacillus segetis TaxID=1325360 RepID=UPI0018873074|nr:PLP-dependent aminotransferase family protein [Paenibacillus segetis]
MKQSKVGENIVEVWLREFIQRLPLGFGKDVDTPFVNEGYISFAQRQGDGGTGTGSWRELAEEARKSTLSVKQEASTSRKKREREAEQGYLPLRQWLVKAYAEAEGAEEENAPDHFILVDDAGEALHLLLRSLVKPGEVVLVETPASPEALAEISSYGAIAVQVACDHDGMLPVDVQKQMNGHKPVFVYVTPHYSNPSGTVWSLERKLALLEICEANGVFIVEDDTAGAVPFQSLQEVNEERGKNQVSISFYRICQMQEKHEGKLRVGVLSIGAFEGTLFPNLPLAWIRGEPKEIHSLLDVRLAGPVSLRKIEREQTLHTLLEMPSFNWRDHAVHVEVEYAARRKLMLELLSEPAWKGTEVIDPGGGLFLWLRLPAGLSSEALLRASLLQGVAFVPGVRCYASEPDTARLRLTFAAQPEAQLRQGMAVIAGAITEFTARAAE